MKQIFGFLLIIVMLASCNSTPQSGYTAQWSPDGKDSVVNVVYIDQNGHQNTFLMNYMLFHMLYGNGGYNNVYNYYRGHPNEFVYYTPARYRTYSESYTPTRSRYYTNSNNKTYSSPSRDGTSKSYTTPTKSYTSPSRSYTSPSKSYTSPSRSSSPTKSYSSPSRSSSSRSYSSPRH